MRNFNTYNFSNGYSKVHGTAHIRHLCMNICIFCSHWCLILVLLKKSKHLNLDFNVDHRMPPRRIHFVITRTANIFKSIMLISCLWCLWKELNCTEPFFPLCEPSLLLIFAELFPYLCLNRCVWIFFYFPDIFLQKFKMKMNYFDELVFKNTIYKLFIIIIWRVAPDRDCNGDFLA
jgi:hypothetical protein